VDADPVSFLRSLAAASAALAKSPAGAAAANARLLIGLTAAVRATVERAACTLRVRPLRPTATSASTTRPTPKTRCTSCSSGIC